MKNKIPFFILVFMLILSCKQNSSENTNVENIKIDTTNLTIHRIDSLHTRRNMKDYDKSLVDYIKSKPNKPSEEKNVIYLLPFGNIKPEIDSIIQNNVEYLEAFFQLPVKVLPEVKFEEILKNAKIKTRLVPEDDYWDLDNALLTPLTLTTASQSIGNLYVYENLGNSSDDKEVATQLEIKAKYNNIDTKYSVYINESISSPGTGNPGDPDSSVIDDVEDHFYNIWRNYHYQLIGTISGIGDYTSISVEVKILPWTIHEYAVPLE